MFPSLNLPPQRLWGSNALIKRKANLFYQLTLNRELALDVNLTEPPKRGESAFQTDICVFEELNNGIKFPRVVSSSKRPSLHMTSLRTQPKQASTKRYTRVYAMACWQVSSSLFRSGSLFTMRTWTSLSQPRTTRAKLAYAISRKTSSKRS